MFFTYKETDYTTFLLLSIPTLEMDIHCSNDACWYKNNPDRCSEYDEKKCSSLVVSEEAVRNYQLDYDDLPASIQLCDVCWGSCGETCNVCQKSMYDPWIHTRTSSICRMCLGFEETDRFFDEEYIRCNHDSEHMDGVVACLKEMDKRDPFNFNKKIEMDQEEEYTEEILAEVREYLNSEIEGLASTKAAVKRKRRARKGTLKERARQSAIADIFENFPGLSKVEAENAVSKFKTLWRNGSEEESKRFTATQIFSWTLDNLS